MLDYFAEDAIDVTAHGHLLESRNAISDFIRPAFAADPWSSPEYEVLNVSCITPDLSVVHAFATTVDESGKEVAAKGTPPAQKTLFCAVLIRRNNLWRISASQSTVIK
jgi:uncharacterized protein (TIGR02246 family)